MDPNQNQNIANDNSETPAQPDAGNVITPTGAPAAPDVPAAQPVTPTPAEVPAVTAPPAAAKSRRKPLLIALAALIVVAGGFAAYYFGYYTNSSVILSQSLSNTGTGYTKMVDYLNTQNKIDYKGVTGGGSYTFKSGSTSTDGNLSFKSDGTNSDTTFDVGLGVSRISAEVMTIKSSGTNPDVYFKASGIKGFGALTGSPQIDSTVNQLDGKWIVVDHTIFDNLEAQGQLKSTSTPPTADQVMDELRAFGKVNQQYVFTTNPSKSVTVVQKKYGLETVDGHKTYHYKMAFNKANLKQYITAQRDALNASKLEAWIKANNYQDQVNSGYTQLEKSADNVKSSDTFDLWTDVNSRLVYKVRVNDTTNPATNYVDLGLDYKDGATYPFFISGRSTDSSGAITTYSATATLDTKANSVAFKLNVGSHDVTLNANMTFKPSNQAVSVTAPAGAETLMQVMDQLGLGDLVNPYLQSSGSSTAAPAKPVNLFR